MIKTCINCNENFEAKNIRKKYCSRSCKSKYTHRVGIKEVECPYCKKVFMQEVNTTKFCSTSCASKHTHENFIRKCNCTLCGEEFDFKGTTKPLYCSTCRKKQDVEKVRKYQVKKGLVCQLGVGKGGWQTSEDNASTRSSRTTEYIEKCYLRFNGIKECVICDDSNNIHVHHLDHDHFNNDIENLTYMCPFCHRNHHTGNITTEQVLMMTEKKLAAIKSLSNR